MTLTPVEHNGAYQRADALLSDPNFRDAPAIRDKKLVQLRDAIRVVPDDASYEAPLEAKRADDYPGMIMRVRTSTSAKDLHGVLTFEFPQPAPTLLAKPARPVPGWIL